MSLLLTFQEREVAIHEAMEHFSFEADQIHRHLHERLQANALLLRGSAGLFEASDNVTREDWRRYTETIRASDIVEGIQGMGFIKIIEPTALDEHITSIQAEGFPDYAVAPSGPRDIYTSIVYLEPMNDRNRRALGFDMFSEPTRRHAMEQARDTGLPAISGRVQLVQETAGDSQPGTLMFVPVYRQELPVDTIAQRRESLIGWTYSPYGMTDLMNGILSHWTDHEGEGVGLSVYIGEKVDASSLLYTSVPDAPSGSTEFTQQRQLEFHGQSWLLVVDHLSAMNINCSSAWAVLIGGLALTEYLFALLRSLTRRQVEASRTANLLAQAMDYVPSYIYLKGYRAKYTFCNHALLDSFGCTAEDLIGTYHSHFFNAEVARQLAARSRPILMP